LSHLADFPNTNLAEEIYMAKPKPKPKPKHFAIEIETQE
jgi:hypothetical protein